MNVVIRLPNKLVRTVMAKAIVDHLVFLRSDLFAGFDRTLVAGSNPNPVFCGRHEDCRCMMEVQMEYCGQGDGPIVSLLCGSARHS